MIVMLWGAGIGLCLVGLAVGLRPVRPSLAQAQQLLSQQGDDVRSATALSAPARPRRTSPVASAARMLGRLGLPGAALRADLELAGMDPEAFLTGKVAVAVAGLFMPMLAQAVFLLVGVLLPPLLLVIAGLACAGVLFFVPDGQVRTRAKARQAEARQALDILLGLAATSLAAGDGLEAAFEGAAAVGGGFAFGAFRQAGVKARRSRRPVWECYGELARTLGLAELDEMAATVELASGEGARIADSLAAKSMSLRGRVAADRLAESVSTTEKMQLPVGLMLIGFLAVMAFPAMFKLLVTM